MWWRERAKQFGTLGLLAATLYLARNAGARQVTQTPTSVVDPEQLVEARAALDAGKPQKAEEILQHSLAKTPTSGEAHFLLGFALFREVQSHASDAADLADTVRHGSFLDLREKNARASLAQYTEGARFARPSAFDLKIVALDYVLLGDEPDADKWLTKSLEWNPKDEQAWYYEGRVRYKQAHYPEAAQAFEHALQLDARDIRAEDNLGLALEGMGDTTRALAALNTAVAWTRQSQSRDDAPLVDLGAVLIDHQRQAEAVSYLAQATALDAKDLRAHKKLAEAYRDLQRWPEAQAELEAAVVMSPEDASLHFMLGQVYRRTGQAAKANAEMQRSAVLEARDESAARATPAHQP